MKEYDTLMALKSLSQIFNKILQKQNRFKTKKVAASLRLMDTTFKQYNTPPAPQQLPTHEQPRTTNQIHKPQRPNKYNTRYRIKKYGVCAVIDPDTENTLQYQQLIQNPKYKSIWMALMSNEIGQLTQDNDNVKGTNTMFFLPFEEIPIN